MELKDTVDLMTSDDYKDRLKAEYLQTKIRWLSIFRPRFVMISFTRCSSRRQRVRLTSS